MNMKRKIRLALCSVLVLVLLLWAAPALAVPPLPHAFYGTVTTNGDDAVVGTVVSAKINGEAAGSYTTTVAGQYGDADTRDYLAVSSVSATDGDTINFFVDGISTGLTDTFQTGGGPSVMNLALTIADDSITGEVVEYVTGGQTNIVVDATDIANTTITVSTLAGQGTVTITVEKYYSNPHPTVTLPATMIPSYIDITVTNPAAVDWPMYVKQTYTDAEVAGLNEATLGMYYYKAADTAWHRCSDTGVNTAANYIWANMTSAELSGSPVAIGGQPPAGGGGGAPGAMVTLNLTGLVATPPLLVDAGGLVQSTCQLITTDGKLTLDIVAGTELRGPLGNPLASLSAAPEPSPPAAPSDETIVAAYRLTPSGATFSPQITLTIEYDPATLAEGLAEQDLYIAYWDGSNWLALTTTVDAGANTAEGKLSHFTTFAVIAPAAPLLPAPAAFVTTDLSITPAEVEPNEAVTISVSVANTGGTEGSYSVVLMINDATEAVEIVTIAAGDSQSVSFSVTKEDTGSYSIAIDELSGNFTVTAPVLPPEEKPINWPVVGGVIAGVIVVVIIIALLFRRRAY